MSDTGAILIVDDEAPIVDFMTEALTEEGYQVYSANDGVAALRVIEMRPPDVILLDLHMPGLTGNDVLQHLQRTSRVNVPIVLMTADTRAALELSSQGVAACLLKPFDLDDLFSCVENALQSSFAMKRHSSPLPSTLE